MSGRHGRMLDPVRQCFILHRHLAKRRNVVSVSHTGSQAAALCSQFTQMGRVSRNIIHTNLLANVSAANTGTNTDVAEWMPRQPIGSGPFNVGFPHLADTGALGLLSTHCGHSPIDC